MTRIRRRLLRDIPPAVNSQATRRRERWQQQLAADRASLRRWMSRFKRAFTTVDRLQSRIARLERQLSQSA